MYLYWLIVWILLDFALTHSEYKETLHVKKSYQVIFWTLHDMLQLKLTWYCVTSFAIFSRLIIWYMRNRQETGAEHFTGESNQKVSCDISWKSVQISKKMSDSVVTMCNGRIWRSWWWWQILHLDTWPGRYNPYTRVTNEKKTLRWILLLSNTS